MEKEQKELIDKIYELGFEVGYNNHSEIGWVFREYNRLMEEASKLKIKSPESYYDEGKNKGRLSRDRGAIGQKLPDKQATVRSDTGGMYEVEDNFDDFDADCIYSPAKKISLSNFPRMSEKIRVSEIPRLLKGFKFLIRK